MTTKHGISIGLSQHEDKVFFELKIIGKLTHEDYELITPMLDSAVQGIKQPKINALINALEFEGWELRAAWDDFKLGIKHGREFQKIAIVGNKKWQEYSAKIGSWFISGEAKYFENLTSAQDWLNS